MLKPVSYSDTLVVSLEEATLHLRRVDRDDDTLVKTYIKAATLWAENFAGIALVDQTWDYFFDAYPDGVEPYGRYIKIPRPPLLEIEGAFYRYGSEGEFADYLVDYAMPPSMARLHLGQNGSWPTTDGAANAGRIRFRAGYLDESSPGDGPNVIPDDIKAAILLYMANLYEVREFDEPAAISSRPPWGAEQLLRNYRVETSLA